MIERVEREKKKKKPRKFAFLRSLAKRETVSSISRGIWVNRIQRRRRSNRIFIIFVKTELLIIISSKPGECTSLLSKFPPITKNLTVGKTKLDRRFLLLPYFAQFSSLFHEFLSLNEWRIAFSRKEARFPRLEVIFRLKSKRKM